MKLASTVVCVILLFALRCEAQAQSSVAVSRGQITIIQEVNVPALEPGVIGGVKVRPGQRVAAGELLGNLNDIDVRLALKRVEIEAAIARQRAESSIHIELSKKAHQVSLAELRRGEEAVARYAKAISLTEMDRLRFSAEQAELAIQQAEELQVSARLEVDLKQNEVAIAKRKVERHQFVSPLTGVVADVHVEESEWVEAGTPVFRVLRLDRLQCEGFISIVQAGMVSVGQPVKITVKVNETKSIEVTGELTYISHDIDKFKNDVRVTAEFDNSKLTIRQGMRAEMEILPATPVAGKSRPVR
jgi:multidrug efflux pump subunit AcrA (membrane-fusion protein)